MPRTIEVLFGARPIRASRALLRSLQPFGKVIQTPLNRPFFVTTGALLPVVQHLLAFANPIRNAIACKPISRIFQLPRRTLLALAPATHRTRRLLDILLQVIHCFGERVFAFGQLLARLFRVIVLRVLPTAAREIFHVFRNLTLPRSRLCGTLSQIRDLLLPSRRSLLPAALSIRAVHLL